MIIYTTTNIPIYTTIYTFLSITSSTTLDTTLNIALDTVLDTVLDITTDQLKDQLKEKIREKIGNTNPLEQFRIYSSPMIITNIVVILISINIIYNIIIWLSLFLGSRWNIIKISLISTLIGLYKSIINNSSQYMTLFPMIYTIFSIILVSNVLGLIPYGFTPTTHISLTLSISLSLIIGITIIGNQSTSFFSLFVPSGTPIYLVPLIVGIEVISYLSRIFSLSLRLTANISAGHCLIGVIAMLSYTVLNSVNKLLIKVNIIVIPLILLVALYSLELLVACMQAYVFTLLTCSYIKDVKALKSN